jgi:hypothetical protein
MDILGFPTFEMDTYSARSRRSRRSRRTRRTRTRSR